MSYQTKVQTLTLYSIVYLKYIKLFEEVSLDMYLNSTHLISVTKSLPFLGNFCIGVKNYHFSSEIIFGQLL